jgi:hypothetical protein
LSSPPPQIIEYDDGRFGWLHDDAPSFETRRFAQAVAAQPQPP